MAFRIGDELSRMITRRQTDERPSSRNDQSGSGNTNNFNSSRQGDENLRGQGVRTVLERRIDPFRFDGNSAVANFSSTPLLQADPTTPRGQAEEIVNRHGGRDNFDHKAAAPELAEIVQQDPELGLAITNEIYSIIEEGDRDEIAQDMIEAMTVNDLVELAETESGRSILERARQELENGPTHGDEEHTIRQIDLALHTAEFGEDREADIDQAADDVLAVYGDSRNNPTDGGEALAAEIRALEAEYGPGAGEDLMEELYNRDPFLFAGLIADSSDPDHGISGTDKEVISTTLGDFYEGMTDTQQADLVRTMAQFSSGVLDGSGIHIANLVAISGSTELQGDLAKAFVNEYNGSHFGDSNLLAAAAIAVSGSPAAARELLDHIKEAGINGITGSTAIGDFLYFISNSQNPDALADFIGVLDGVNGSYGLTADYIADVLQGLVDFDLLDSEAVRTAVADLLGNMSGPRAALVFNELGPEAFLSLESALRDGSTAGVVRDALAGASQTSVLSDDFINGVAGNADLGALARLTGNAEEPLSDEFLVLIGKRVERDGIEREWTRTQFPVEIRYADPNANIILGNIAASSPTASNELLQSPSFVRFALEMSRVSHDIDGVQAIMKAGTSNTLPRADLEIALRNIGYMLGQPDSWEYDYAGSIDTLLEPEMALTLGQIYQDNAQLFAIAAGTTSDESFVFDLDDVRNVMAALVEHDGNEEIMGKLDASLQVQIAYHMSIAASDPSRRDNSEQIIGHLLAAYGDERARHIRDEAAREDARAEFIQDLLLGVFTALPNFAPNPIGAGSGSIAANVFATLIEQEYNNLDEAKIQLNEQQRRDEQTMKLAVLQAFYNNVPAMENAIEAYDRALRETGHPGILENGELNIATLDPTDPADQQRIAALLALTNPAAAVEGTGDEAQVAFDMIRQTISDIQNNREAVEDNER